MKVVIPGGTGQIGQILDRELRQRGHEVVVISRSASDPSLRWDGVHDGPWMDVIDGADVVINLAGRTVNCRYNWRNLNQMMASRLDSTLAIGRAIARAKKPPRVWLQQSTASIYPHTPTGPANEEATPINGGEHPDSPDYWMYSVHIARAWELALDSCDTPDTRKVALRTGYTMSHDAGGVFDWMLWLVDWGLGGPFCGGQQYISWITGQDYAAAVMHLIETDDVAGPVNMVAPHPVTNSKFMAALTAEVAPALALPIARWMAQIGAVFLRTDVELMLKSRRVVPSRLLESGFQFQTSTWTEAVPGLVSEVRGR